MTQPCPAWRRPCLPKDSHTPTPAALCVRPSWVTSLPRHTSMSGRVTWRRERWWPECPQRDSMGAPGQGQTRISPLLFPTLLAERETEAQRDSEASPKEKPGLILPFKCIQCGKGPDAEGPEGVFLRRPRAPGSILHLEYSTPPSLQGEGQTLKRELKPTQVPSGAW